MKEAISFFAYIGDENCPICEAVEVPEEFAGRYYSEAEAIAEGIIKPNAVVNYAKDPDGGIRGEGVLRVQIPPPPQLKAETKNQVRLQKNVPLARVQIPTRQADVGRWPQEVILPAIRNLEPGRREIPRCPPTEEYYISNEGFLCSAVSGGNPIICNFVPEVARILQYVNKQGDVTRSAYVIAVWVANHPSSWEVTLDALVNEVATILKFIPSATVAVECKLSAKKIHNFLAQTLSRAQGFTVYEQPGWALIGGMWNYIHDGKILNLENQILKTGRLITTAYGIHPFDVLKKMLKISTNPVISSIGIGFALLGVLFEPFKQAGFPPKMVLFINGTTGVFKTSLAKVLFRYFESDDSRIRSFRDTKASFECGLGEAVDSVAVFDDFSPGVTESERRELKEKLEVVVRYVGDNIGRNRSNTKLENVVGKEPCGVVAITGELMSGSQSSQLRCFQLPIEKGEIDLRVLSHFQSNSQIWSMFVGEFIRYVENNFQGIVTWIRNGFDGMRMGYLQDVNEGRIVDAAVTLQMAVEILCNYLRNFITDESESVRAIMVSSIHQVAMLNQDLCERENPAFQYAEILYLMISQKIINIADKRVVYESARENWGGFYDGNEFLFLKAEAAYIAALNYSKQLGQCLPDKKICHYQLAELGLINSLSNGSSKVFTVKLGPDGNRVRFLKIDGQKFKNLFD